MTVNNLTKWAFIILVILTIFCTIFFLNNKNGEIDYNKEEKRIFPVQCHSHGYMTVFHEGRLGNQLSQYATLFAHSKRLGVKAVILPEMRNKLIPHFPEVSFQPAPDNCQWNWTKVKIGNIFDVTTTTFETRNVLIDEYVFHFEAFRYYQHQLITEEFVFDPKVKSDAQRFLSQIRNETPDKKVLLVSIHARRTDYKDWMARRVGGFLASQKFYMAAMDIFRKKYNSKETKVVFVLASDDVGWCRKVFANETDLIFAASANTTYSKLQPTFDLAVLANCDHSIVSYGTFGFWTAFLKGKGDTIMVKGTSTNATHLEKNIPEAEHTWEFLQDPCYATDVNKTIFLKQECLHL